MQQPDAHVIGPQPIACWHEPLMQSWPRGQLVHIAPPVPQAIVEPIEGVTQVPRAQQPVQVPGPQAATTQLPFTHCSPLPQRVHMPPVAPHANGESPT